MRLNKKALVCALIDRDLNQIELARLSDVSRITISNVFCGKSCTYETGVKIANALNMKLDDLLEKKDNYIKVK